jgi:hypothetical protein
MSKLIFAGVVLVADLSLHGMPRRRSDSLPPGFRTFGAVPLVQIPGTAGGPPAGTPR